MSKSTYAGAKGRGKSPPFVGLPSEMIDSAAFRDLKAHAVKLLVAIARSYYGWNNGSLMMPFEVARTWGFTNERTYTKALRELVEHGFIEMTRPAVRRGRVMAARWAITWKPIDEPVGDHKHDARPTEKPSNDWLKWAPNRPAQVPAKKQNSTGESACRRLAELPVKNSNSSKATGKSASQKPAFGDSRQADLPADLISTRAPSNNGRAAVVIQLVPGTLAVRGALS